MSAEAVENFNGQLFDHILAIKKAHGVHFCLCEVAVGTLAVFKVQGPRVLYCRSHPYTYLGATMERNYVSLRTMGTINIQSF